MDHLAWDERYAVDEFVWTAELEPVPRRRGPGADTGTLLDLACGEGRNTVWLTERGWAATGVDFFPVGLDKARRLADTRHVSVQWERADVTEYQPPAEGFDLVVVMYLHLPEIVAPDRVPPRRRRGQKPGGTLLVVGHDSTNPNDGWGGPKDTAVLYGPDDVVADVEGLDIVKAERVRRAVQTDDGERTAIDVLVRAVRRPGQPS